MSATESVLRSSAVRTVSRWLGQRTGWLQVDDEFFQLGQPVAEVPCRHDLGECEADSGQFSGKEFGIGLSSGCHLPVALNAGPVAVILPVLGEQDQRRGVGRLGRKGQVQPSPNAVAQTAWAATDPAAQRSLRQPRLPAGRR